MKVKIIILCASVFLMPAAAYCECVALTKNYSSCKPGYYYQQLQDFTSGEMVGYCRPCANGDTDLDGNIVSGMSPDTNTADITSCYLPAGIYSDDSGQYEITEECHYNTGI